TIPNLYDPTTGIQNFDVTGLAGVSFDITFKNNLGGMGQNPLTISPANGADPSGAEISTKVPGSAAAPTQAAVQTQINQMLSSTGIAGATATVIGATGGPF